MQTYTSVGVHACLFLLFCCLALLKVWSTSYFLYSQLASSLLGAAVAVGTHTLAGRLFPTIHSVSRSGKLGCACVGLMAIVGLVAYRAEVNAAPVMRVPRRDCTLPFLLLPPLLDVVEGACADSLCASCVLVQSCV